ncbi:MAG: DUF3486 family protein [Betaproteobacteria bacterium]|nr:DUF3486 family protein [Betaproteobacteria bacterium]
MTRRSSVKGLDPRIRAAVDAAIREDRATLDDIVAMINRMGEELGTGDTASRSAVHRYRSTFEESMKVFQLSREMAATWGKSLEEDPQSDVARLAAQVLSGVALNTAQTLINADESVPSNEVMFLAKALDHLGRFTKSTTDVALRLRKEIATEAADRAAKVAKSQGLTTEAVDTIRREILGIAA